MSTILLYSSVLKKFHTFLWNKHRVGSSEMKDVIYVFLFKMILFWYIRFLKRVLYLWEIIMYALNKFPIKSDGKVN